MKNKILPLLGFLLFNSLLGFSQELWNNSSDEVIKKGLILERENHPFKYQIFNINIEVLKQKLQNAPTRNFINDNSNVTITLPTPNGNSKEFTVYEQSDFEEGLAQKYPNFKSYVGYQIDNKATRVHFTINANGFNGIILSPNHSTIYIDNYTTDLKKCLVYYRSDIENNKSFTCHTQDVNDPTDPFIIEKNANTLAQRNNNKIFRQYRMAMACTIEYAAFHINRAGAQNRTESEKKQVVLSAMQTTMNRVNSLYERDMALRMNLVANNDQIIFITADEFNNDTAGTLINQSQTIIDRVIGYNNYDIGHTVSTGGGGLAQLNSPCSTNKARGITGSSSPINDPFDIDYVAHEVGHQFGAQHTFNNSCSGNRSSSSSYEPGSGTTIMAYAGICAPNVANNSDDHFHNHSISQMSTFVSNNGGTCSTNINLTNTPPTIQSLPNYTIPYGTPFKLTAAATDAEGDQLTYVWEQMNRETSTQPPVATATTGPNYKSVKPSTSPTRYFPNFESVLNGNLIPTWEVTPNVARSMAFIVTVRDNNISGAQTKLGSVNVNVANTGAFAITYPTTENTIWAKQSQQNITWNVAGTTENGINTQNVKISISYDGGATFTTLLESTPNDGAETITIPNINSDNARIMIEAVGNIYYTISKKILIGYDVTVEDICVERTLNYNNAVLNTANLYYTSEFNITDNFTVNNIKVAARLNAERASDVRLHLKNNGETGFLTNTIIGNSTCEDTTIQNVNAVFENNTTLNINCNTITSGSTLKPFANFTPNGVNANGQWIIYSQKVSNRVVSLSQLKLTLCGQRFTYTLSDNNIELTNFKLYPNPNKGSFTLIFDAQSKVVNVEIFDIRGRMIYNKDFNSSGTFNQQINLNNIAKGIYLVKVFDGKKSRTEKIIIE